MTSVSEIISFTGASNYIIVGDKQLQIIGIKAISAAHGGEMTFCSALGERGLKLISESKASVIICPLSLKNHIGGAASTLIFVENPRLSFLRCVKQFFLTPQAEITMEKDVEIHESSVIGGEGFGYERNEKGDLEKFPHIGGVIIEHAVRIGANVCIDRGALDDTVIGAGTKIDNLVHVAHGVKIGKNCLVVAGSVLGGSCHIGDNSIIGMGARILPHIKLGKNVTVGAGAVVTKDVADNNVVIGVPARPLEKKIESD